MTKQRMMHPVLALTVALCATLAFAACPIFADDNPKHDRQKDCERLLRQADLEQMPFLWAVLAPPILPVEGSDGLIHLVYELTITSLWPAPARIEAVEVVDPIRDNLVVEVVSGDEVASKLLVTPGVDQSAEFSATLGPDRTGAMLFDLTFEEREDVPRVLAHRVTASVDLESPLEFSQLGGCTEVSRRPAIVLSPPLKGNGWLNGGGCCESHHRTTVFTFNGTLQISERFASDLSQVDTEHRVYVGDPANVTNWVGYLAEVVAAAPGEVVTVVDGLPDQVPLTDSTDITRSRSGGNHVIIDMGSGRFAEYAHLAPQSIIVHPGERVRRGQLLGLLGNSGNSTAPHLHFEVKDGGSVANANGVPYVFDRWVFQGRVVDDLGAGIVDIDPTGSGKRQNKTLPLDYDVMGFPDYP